MFGELSIGVALLAGLVSFLSPCMLAIVPGFLAYLAGTSIKDAKAKRWEIFINSVFFVLGFGVIFALLGVLLNTVLESIAFDVLLWLGRIGGVIVIVFGLYLMGILKIGFLEKEYKFKVPTNIKSKYLTSFLFGASLAVGWTPCVGVALGAIFGLAITSPGGAFILLLAYSLGLGIPFMIVGLFTSQAQSIIGKYQHVLKYVNIVFGLILVAIGVLIFTNNLFVFSNTVIIPEISI